MVAASSYLIPYGSGGLYPAGPYPAGTYPAGTYPAEVCELKRGLPLFKVA